MPRPGEAGRLPRKSAEASPLPKTPFTRSLFPHQTARAGRRGPVPSRAVSFLPRLLPKEAVMRRFLTLASLLLLNVRAPAQTSSGPLLLRQPTVSQTQIAFSYAGDIWVVPRQGGEARRLAAGQGSATNPLFSPDGSMIAYT